MHHAFGYLMYQHKYTSYLLEEFHCFNFTPVASPLELSVKLFHAMGDPLPDPFIFRCLVEKLNFLQHTRLDILFVV